MNTKGFLAGLLSVAICTASISTASVSATEIKFDIPVCLTQNLHGVDEYKTGTYITNDYVNYRQGYSTDFPKYGIIPKGTTVEVTEIFNGWGKINYNGKIAWFKLEYADYVQPVTQTTTTTAITTPASTEKLGIYVTTGDVYYRKGHKTECEAYGVIPKGTKVEVIEIYQGWGRTNYEGKDSWFYLDYAEFYSTIKETVPATTSTTTTTTTTSSATSTSSTTAVTLTTTVIAPLDLNYSEGDIDGNGIVDASDASTILAYYAQIQTGGASLFNEKQILFADVNGDKKIDSSDASLVLAYYCYTSTNKDILSMKEWASGNLVPPVETTTQPITTTTTQNIFTTTASDYTQTSTETQSTTSSVETTTTTASETTSTTLTETTTTSSETTTTTTNTTTTTASETTTTSETSISTTVTTVVTTPPVTTTTYQYPLAAKRLNEVGWKIENAFNAAAGITYYGQKPDMPQDDVTTMEWYAEFGFKNGKGNCYVMAAMFCEMAKTLGYEAHMISGKVPLRSGGYGPHSWVELTVDGKVYVCDPDFANETKRNGFMIEYGQSGTWKYTIEKRMS